MKFLYTTDSGLKELLLQKNCKLLQELNNTHQITWVFEINPSDFDLYEFEFNTYAQQSKCVISNKLIMQF